jgi:hypothetical protein
LVSKILWQFPSVFPIIFRDCPADLRYALDIFQLFFPIFQLLPNVYLYKRGV